MTADLNNRHRDTLEKIFRHPSGNVEWREVLSLLEAVGDVVEEHNGKLKVTLGSETEVLHRPHDKDVAVQTIVDLRRMLDQAGLGPGAGQAVRDELTRDHGDGRWGKPT